MLDALEAVSVNALLLQRPDDALDHAVLLRAVRGDELLAEAVAANQTRVMAAGEDQAVVRSQQELPVDAAQRAEAVDQGMLQRTGGRGCLAGARQVPAEKFTRMAINDQMQELNI
ncbi:hypothetical protein [Falsirhodobacter sp. 1013]|uniref:hypothetical protein n=1 Tax=Falsirhodobacter sp. 1013 TaxID=3417566 RepID=UPI003EBA0420